MAKSWHIEDIKVLEQKLNTDLTDGLTGREARSRLEKEIKREKGSRKSLFVGKKRSAWESFFSFALTPSVILLLIISLLTSIFGRALLGGSVFSVTLLGALAGGFINLRSRRRLEEMREYASPMLKVKRGGNIFHTDGRNVVEGDIIILSAGDLLTCDARLIHSEDFAVDELFYTNNGLKRQRVIKDHTVTYEKESNIKAPDALNMIYAGSAVSEGTAIALVTDTGNRTYLSEFLSDGALGGKDSEPEGVKKVKPLVYKVTFLGMSSLLLLSLLGLLTLRSTDFICVFLMLLSSVALLISDLLMCGAFDIFSSAIKRMATPRKKNKNSFAAVRNIKSFDALTGITDLVLVGKAGLSDGINHIFSAYTVNGPMDDLTPSSVEGRRLLNCIYTYVKALRESGNENYFSINGYADSLFAHVRNCGFDISAASLAIRSLYFAHDKDGNLGYACAETANEFYRTTMVFGESVIEHCKAVRCGDDMREITAEDIKNITDFCKDAEDTGLQCLYIISEYNGTAIFEGVITLCEYAQPNLDYTVKEMKEMGINTTVFLLEDDDHAKKLAESPALSSVFEGKVAYAKDFRRAKKNILDGMGEYRAYIGFTVEDFSSLIVEMRKKGAKVAAYGIDNNTNEILARADIAISCDTLKYSTDKYKESVYEKLPPEGRDTNIRCSQQTRLLAKLIIRRSGEQGGGLSSVLRAFKASRSAYVSFSQSILLFAFLMSGLLSFVAMSVLTGNLLIGPLQASSLAAVFAFLSVTVFSDCVHKREILNQKRCYTEYPADILKSNIPALIARVSVVFILAVAVKILDVLKIFGENATYTMPVYICLVLSLYAEVFLINHLYTQKGESRKFCWSRVVIAYAILMCIGAASTHLPFSTEFYPNGIGSTEFFIVPAYVVLYFIALGVVYFLDKKKKKS